MKMFIGTLSDEAIIKKIREGETPLLPDRNICYKESMTDDEIIKEIINKGRITGGIIHFFAENLSRAMNMANEMSLKNFSQVSNILYKKGVDY